MKFHYRNSSIVRGGCTLNAYLKSDCEGTNYKFKSSRLLGRDKTYEDLEDDAEDFSKYLAFLKFSKALERLLGWIKWLILTLLPILDQNHKGCALKIAKVPLQISFKHSEPFLAFLVNI